MSPKTYSFEKQQGLHPRYLKGCREPRYHLGRLTHPGAPRKSSSLQNALSIYEGDRLVRTLLGKEALAFSFLLVSLGLAGERNSYTLPLPCECQRACLMPTLSSCLPKACWQAQTTQGTILDHLALGVRRACTPESHRTVKITETVLDRVRLQGTAYSRLKHTSSLFWKRPIILFWSFSLSVRLQIFLHLETTEMLLQNWDCGWQGLEGGCHLCTLPRSYYSSLAPHRKELIHLPGVWIFATVTQGTPADLLVWKSAGFIILVP